MLKDLVGDIPSDFDWGLTDDTQKTDPTEEDWNAMFLLFTSNQEIGGRPFPLTNEQCAARLEEYIKEHNLNVTVEDAIAHILQMIKDMVDNGIQNGFNTFSG